MFLIGFAGNVIGKNLILGIGVASRVNNLFNDIRNEKKETCIVRNNEYRSQISNMEMIDSSMVAIDKYIDMVERKAEIISVEGEYYIKYVEFK